MLPIALNGPEQAHCSGLEQLPKILNVPNRNAQRAAYALRWAHWCCQKMLPMGLNGPIGAAEICWRSPWVGLLYWPRTAAEDFECTQYKCLESFLCSQMGPFVLPEKAANGLEWAHWSCSQSCLFSWMGPLMLPKNAANGFDWAH